jgi:hypothetical protein
MHFSLVVEAKDNREKDTYLALKREKEELIKKGQHKDTPRSKITRKMGRLLSDPEERLEKMLQSDKN